MPSYSDRKYTSIINFVEDQIGADVNRDLLKVAIEAQDGGLSLDANVDEIGGTQQTGADLPAALRSVSGDEFRSRLYGEDGNGDLQEAGLEAFDTALGAGDVGVVTYPARALNSLGEDELVARVTDSSGTQVDPVTQALENALAANGSDQFRVDLESNNAGTLPTEQQTPVGVEDTTGSQVDPFDQSDVGQIDASDSGAGSSNAATLDLGDFRKDFDVFVDTTGDATLTVEVSEDGGTTWRQYDSISYNGSSEEVEQFDTAFQHVRAYLNQNRNEVVVVSRGA
jgi:hypothetical protein